MWPLTLAILMTFPWVTGCGQSQHRHQEAIAGNENSIESDAAEHVGAGKRLLLGIDNPKEIPSAIATGWNEKGLRAHRAGEHDEAIGLFSKAVQIAPTYQFARYNLACAHSKLGQLDKAWALLRVLLREDYVFTAPRILEDSDLGPLRNSQRLYPKIQRDIEAVRVQREQDLATGLWIPLVQIEELPSGIRHTIRPGVYLPQTRKFIPLMQPYRYVMNQELDETAEFPYALIDPVSRTLAILRMQDCMNSGWCGALLEVWDLERGVRAYQTEIREDDYGQIFTLKVALNAKALFVQALSPDGWSPWLELPLRNKVGNVQTDVTPREGVKPSLPPQGASYLEATPSGGDDTDGHESGPVLRLRALSAQYQLKRNVLRVGSQSFQLGTGHAFCHYRSALESPLGDKVLIVSVCMSTDMSTEAKPDFFLPIRSFVDEVNLKAGTVKRLVAGRGLFGGGYALDGTLVWRLPRWFDGKKADLSSEQLPTWLRWEAPWY